MADCAFCGHRKDICTCRMPADAPNEAHVEFTEDGRVLSKGTVTLRFGPDGQIIEPEGLIDLPKFADEVPVLTEAARIVAGPRQAAYGHPRDNHACTAALWDAYLLRRFAVAGEVLDGVDCCVLNVLQKLSRFANTRQRDSIVDAAGFLANIEMILDGKWDA